MVAEWQALLRPRLPPAPPVDACEVDRRPDMGKLVTLQPFPATEVHEFQERPVWSGQTIGKTVATGEATDQWRGAISRPHREACKPSSDEPVAAPVRILTHTR